MTALKAFRCPFFFNSRLLVLLVVQHASEHPLGPVLQESVSVKHNQEQS